MQGKILIVDDTLLIRGALALALSAMGFEVTLERSGEGALEALLQEQFDIVLLDIKLPGLGGIETCRALRKQSATVGILMLTVRGSLQDKVESFDAGADDCVLRPFVLRELAALLRAATRRVRNSEATKREFVSVS